MANGTIETKGQTNSLNTDFPPLCNGQRERTNFEKSQYISFDSPRESKKGFSLLNSGCFSFCNIIKSHD